MALFAAIYLTMLFCLYRGLYRMLGPKDMLLIFGAVHVGSVLLLLVTCWGALWAGVPAWMKRQGRS